MTLKLEAILDIHCCSHKLYKRGMADGGGGGGELSFAPPCTCLVSRYSRLPQAIHAGWYPFHCLTSVSFSFSTFLCLAASWMGVYKKYSHFLCGTGDKFYCQHQQNWRLTDHQCQLCYQFQQGLIC